MDLEYFSYATFHDLQEPLKIISNFSDLLEKELTGQLTKETQLYFNFISSSIVRMSKLTESMMTYLKLGKNDHQMEQVSLSSILDKVLTNNQALIRQKKAIIQSDLPPIKINCFPQQIEMLLSHLINNGLKFNKHQQPQLIIAGVKKNQEWSFSIKDNGIGISEQYKDLIYRPFKRLNSQEDFPGSGIGLSICRRITTLHGGKIWHASNKSGGTTFYFTISQ